MTLKHFPIAFITFALTTGLLVIIGDAFTIPWLMFHHESVDRINGLFTTTGSVIPLIMGLLVSLFVEKIFNSKVQS